MIETVTFSFDNSNLIIKKLMEAMVAAGARKQVSGLDEAIEELKEGQTIKCENFEDFLSKMQD